MSQDQQERGRIAKLKRTSPCHSSVLNMGLSPRTCDMGSVSQTNDNSGNSRGCGALPQTLQPRQYLPSHQAISTLLSGAVSPSLPYGFVTAFARNVVVDVNRTAMEEEMLCNTPISWIVEALHGLHASYCLCSLDDMFPTHGTMSDFLDECYVMDVILNRRVKPNDTAESNLIPPDSDKVVIVWCYKAEELGDDFDFKFRTVQLYSSCPRLAFFIALENDAKLMLEF